MSERLIALSVGALLWFVRVAPRPVLNILGEGLSTLAFLLRRKDVRRIGDNVQRIYGLPAHSVFAKDFARQVLSHQIFSALETLKAATVPDAVTIVDEQAAVDAMRRSLAAGVGLVVVTGHMGSWELVGRVGARAAGSFHALAKPAAAVAVTRALSSLRGRFGIDVLWANRQSALRSMVKVLRAGKALGFVMDQKPEARVGPLVTFFGQRTEFVAGPAIVSRSTGAPVMGVFCMREGPWRYRIFTEELLPAHHSHDDADAATQIMATAIERMIRLYPEQWAWNYKRWRWS